MSAPACYVYQYRQTSRAGPCVMRTESLDCLHVHSITIRLPTRVLYSIFRWRYSTTPFINTLFTAVIKYYRDRDRDRWYQLLPL